MVSKVRSLECHCWVQVYLVDVERQNESLTNRWREVLVGLDEGVGVLCHVVEVEHVIQVAVLVGDQVKHHVAVLLVGVDVMENHQSVTIVTGGHSLSCLSVDDVKQSLEKKANCDYISAGS